MTGVAGGSLMRKWTLTNFAPTSGAKSETKSETNSMLNFDEMRLVI